MPYDVDYYSDYQTDTFTGSTDFKDTSYCDTWYESHSSSSDSDWDSGDFSSWDSGGTDWGSDW